MSPLSWRPLRRPLRGELDAHGVSNDQLAEVNDRFHDEESVTRTWTITRRAAPTRSLCAALHPITAFQRTALQDTELGGVRIQQGQRVVLFYRSANFDEDVFADPFTFDITRNPNPHVAFGGTGAHFCIGASLARMVVSIMFNAIADVMPDLTPLAPPQRLRSGYLNGIKHWQVDFRTSPA